jgi:hypothetical protein
MISIGVLLLIASGAPTFIAMLLSFRRSQLGWPPLDLAWWVGLGFHFPLILFPPIGFFLIILGIVKRVRKRPRLVA